MHSTSHTLRARWIFPVAGPPLAGGRLTIAQGRITAVEPGRAGAVDRDLPDCAIVPGFVNCHTHLEFSNLDQPLGEPGNSFTDWLRLVVTRRRQQAALGEEAYNAERAAAIARGLAECLAAGTTLVGEITTSPHLSAPYAGSPLSGVLFRELLALPPERVATQIAFAAEHLAGAGIPDGWTAALSPHAPYTVHPALFDAAVTRVCKSWAPLAMHLAESPEEIELLSSQSGPLIDVLASRDAWHPALFRPGMRPLQWLQRLSAAPRTLVVHGNYLDEEEKAFLAAHADRMAVIHCPRTHAYFNHAPFPLAEILRRGGAVGLGTDSRASNPDLGVLPELRLVAPLHPSVAPSTILELATLAGARILGREKDAGSLVAGKRADLVALRLPHSAPTDPHELLLDPQTEIAGVCIGGVWQMAPRGG